MSGKYDDIINLPRPVSAKRLPMPIMDRAAQFSPFAALTGYDSVIRETGRLTDGWVELDESRKSALNEKLRLILENIHTQPLVTVTYFQRDERKSGGSYITQTGRVKKIDTYEQTILLTDGLSIPIEGVYEIEWE